MFFPVTSINAGNVFIFAHHYTANGWLLTTVLEIQALLQELIQACIIQQIYIEYQVSVNMLRTGWAFSVE